MTDPQPAQPDTSRWKEPAFWFGVGVIVAFAGLSLYLIWAAGSVEEIGWTRMLYVYGGLEAIVFAAAGYIFGREVHRERAEAAEGIAQDAVKRLRDANQEKLAAQQREAEISARAQALASVVRSERATTDAQSNGAGVMDGARSLNGTAVDRIAAVTDDLFPTRSSRS